MPPRWKEVLGIAPTAPAADELVVTIAEFAIDPWCGRPIHGVLHGRGGSFDSFVATASDGTGSMEVLLKRDETENFREFASARRYEMWLVPLVDRSPLDELAEQMRGIAEAPAASYLATRIVPL